MYVVILVYGVVIMVYQNINWLLNSINNKIYVGQDGLFCFHTYATDRSNNIGPAQFYL